MSESSFSRNMCSSGLTIQKCPRCKRQHASVKKLCPSCIDHTRNSIGRTFGNQNSAIIPDGKRGVTSAPSGTTGMASVQSENLPCSTRTNARKENNTSTLVANNSSVQSKAPTTTNSKNSGNLDHANIASPISVHQAVAHLPLPCSTPAPVSASAASVTYNRGETIMQGPELEQVFSHKNNAATSRRRNMLQTADNRNNNSAAKIVSTQKKSAQSLLQQSTACTPFLNDTMTSISTSAIESPLRRQNIDHKLSLSSIPASRSNAAKEVEVFEIDLTLSPESATKPEPAECQLLSFSTEAHCSHHSAAARMNSCEGNDKPFYEQDRAYQCHIVMNSSKVSEIRNDIKPATSNITSYDTTKKSVLSLTASPLATTDVKQQSSLQNPAYECLVCGKSLTHIQSVQGRLNHLKRCSKKNHVQAKDIKEYDDMQDLSSSPQQPALSVASATPSCSTISGRSSHVPLHASSWHGRAAEDLHLAGEADYPDDVNTGSGSIAPSFSNSTATTSTTAQSKLTSFFQRPIKSLNKVLLAGAKRLAKQSDIASKAAATPAPKQGRGNNSLGNKKPRTSYSNSSKPGTCPAYKRITATNFIVDGFYHANPALSTTYFLTHFHYDHYGGLTSSWNAGTIYCSLSTANLVHEQLRVKKEYLHPIPINTPTVLESRGKAVTITLLDANHCPGAVMMLFQVNGRNILHVGDFRWNRPQMLAQPPLQSFYAGRTRLHELYFDTTYCNEKYAGIPTQEEAIQATIEVVDKEVEYSRTRNKNTLFLFGSYTIGKERVYMQVCEHLNNAKAFVDNRRFKILSALDWTPERKKLLTTDKSNTNIWVVPLGHINFKIMANYLNEHNNGKPFAKKYDRVVGFRPTGWTYSGGGAGKGGTSIVSGRKSGENMVYGVPYSEHSSYSELVDCLVCLKPQKIIPTVSAAKSQEQIDMLLASVQKEQYANASSS
jgi:DNA cross-link repair 1A protein